MADAELGQEPSIFDLLRHNSSEIRHIGLAEPATVLRHLVDHPLSVEELDSDEQTPLHVALAMNHRYEIVRAVASANLKQLEHKDR